MSEMSESKTPEEAAARFLKVEKECRHLWAALREILPASLQAVKAIEQENWGAYQKQRFLAIDREFGGGPFAPPTDPKLPNGAIVAIDEKANVLETRAAELQRDLRRQQLEANASPSPVQPSGE